MGEAGGQSVKEHPCPGLTHTDAVQGLPAALTTQLGKGGITAWQSQHGGLGCSLTGYESGPDA